MINCAGSMIKRGLWATVISRKAAGQYNCSPAGIPLQLGGGRTDE